MPRLIFFLQQTDTTIKEKVTGKKCEYWALFCASGLKTFNVVINNMLNVEIWGLINELMMGIELLLFRI